MTTIFREHGGRTLKFGRWYGHNEYGDDDVGSPEGYDSELEAVAALSAEYAEISTDLNQLAEGPVVVAETSAYVAHLRTLDDLSAFGELGESK
jgi:hypothetical protein